MLWVVAPADARWIVVDRDRHAVAYPVTRREPVSVTSPSAGNGSRLTVRYTAVAADGTATEGRVVEGAVAG